LKVFTTRLDTLFGLTYVVVSPEHPLLKTIVREDCLKEVVNYVKKASQKNDLEKQFFFSQFLIAHPLRALPTQIQIPFAVDF
jgi:leucyl-tRNA synthetase